VEPNPGPARAELVAGERRRGGGPEAGREEFLGADPESPFRSGRRPGAGGRLRVDPRRKTAEGVCDEELGFPESPSPREWGELAAALPSPLVRPDRVGEGRGPRRFPEAWEGFWREVFGRPWPSLGQDPGGSRQRLAATEPVAGGVPDPRGERGLGGERRSGGNPGRSPAAGPPEESETGKEPGAPWGGRGVEGLQPGSREAPRSGSDGAEAGSWAGSSEPELGAGSPGAEGPERCPGKKTKRGRRNPSWGGEGHFTSTGPTGMTRDGKRCSLGNQGEENRKGLGKLKAGVESLPEWGPFPKAWKPPQRRRGWGNFRPEWAGKMGEFSTGIYSITTLWAF